MNCMGKNLHSYFVHWRNYARYGRLKNGQQRELVRKMKDVNLRKGFNTWRINLGLKQIK